MDWHAVISVQQQTPDSDFCHFSISNARFAFWAFFRKPEKRGSHTGSKRWPGDPVTRTWKLTQMTHWPDDPRTQFHVRSGVSGAFRDSTRRLPANFVFPVCDCFQHRDSNRIIFSSSWLYHRTLRSVFLFVFHRVHPCVIYNLSPTTAIILVL